MSATVQSVLVVSLIAVLAPWFVVRSRVRVPVAVLELLLGILFSKNGLDWIQPSPILSFLSLFGLSFIMFLAGLETDLEQLLSPAPTAGHSRRLPDLALIAGLWIALGLMLGWGLEAAHWVSSGLAVGIMLASSAPTVLLPALKERQLLDEPFGKRILTVALMVDFSSLLAVTVLASTASSGNHLRLFLVLLLFAPIVVVRRSSGWLRRVWLGLGSESVTGQIGVRGVFAVITLFIALAETLGTITVLGAFLAGTAVSAIIGAEQETLKSKLDTIGFGYFIPFFFITLGTQINVDVVFHDPRIWVLTGLFLAAAIVVSMLPSILFRRMQGWRETAAAGLLLGTRLSVTVAGSAVLFQAKIISQSIYLAMILMSILSSIVFPAVFDLVAPSPRVRRQGVLLLGPDRWIRPLARRLNESGIGVVAGRTYSDVEDRERDLKQETRVALILSDNYRANLDQAATVAHRLTPDRIIVEVSGEQREEAQARGYVPFVPSLATIELLQTLVRLPHSNELLISQDVPLQEVTVSSPAVVNRRLRDLRLPHDTLIIAITRGREQIVPRGTTTLDYGDVVTLWCPQTRLPVIEQLFGK